MVPNHQTSHVPVMLEAVLQYLNPKGGELYLDLTAGYGGHAQAVLARTRASATLVDRDQDAIEHLQHQFAGQPVHFVHRDFLAASRELVPGGEQFDLILADLGVSSPHLNRAERGFSILRDGPLDMRMDRRQELTAEKVVNTYSQAELTNVIREYGEEPKAHKIAQAIVATRPLYTTTQLANIVAKAARSRGHKRVHPATRTFQALRLAVNGELEQLEAALPLWVKVLKPGGRLVVISFHSLEDRLVKTAFKELGGTGYDAELHVLTKQPITPSASKIAFNPRARSAKLRAAVKIKTRKG